MLRLRQNIGYRESNDTPFPILFYSFNEVGYQERFDMFTSLEALVVAVQKAWLRHCTAIFKQGGMIEPSEEKSYAKDLKIVTANNASDTDKKVKEAMVRLTTLMGDLRERPDNITLLKITDRSGKIRMGTNTSPQAKEQRRDILNQLMRIADENVPVSELDLAVFQQKTVYSG